MSSDTRPVHSYFSRLNLNVSRTWIEESVRHVRDVQNIRTTPAVIKACFERWLETDISGQGVQAADDSSRLIPVAATRKNVSKMTLPVPRSISVQVLSAVDIGQPLFGQLQRARHVRDENSRVSAEDNSQRPYTQAWVPKEKRMMKMVLTDGARSVEAVEHEPIAQLPDDLRPGAKIVLKGPISLRYVTFPCSNTCGRMSTLLPYVYICRRGIMMLSPANVKYHGGVVAALRRSSVADELEAALTEARRRGQQAGREDAASLPTQRFVQRSKEMVLKNGQRVTTVPGKTFASSAIVRQQPLHDAQNRSTGSSVGIMEDDDDDMFANLSLPEEDALAIEAEFDADFGEDWSQQVKRPRV